LTVLLPDEHYAYYQTERFKLGCLRIGVGVANAK
jgi:hypothetical protein